MSLTNAELLRRRAFEKQGGDTLLESSADELDRLRALVNDYEEALADKRRLAREIDVAMHGEEGAAKQASLCDLVAPAARLRALNEELVGALAGVVAVADRETDEFIRARAALSRAKEQSNG